MTKQDQFDLLMKELAQLLKSKNDEIQLLRWKVADLEAKLKEAEGHVE